MSTFEIYEADTVSIRLTWTRPSGAVKTLTGGTTQSLACNRRSGAVVELTAALENPANGTTIVDVASGDLTIGYWDVQCTLTVSSITQTTEFNIIVLDSPDAP